MSSTIKKILILAANPKNSTPLRLDQEVREINDALKLAKNRDNFEVIQQWAVRPRDMQRAVLESEPRIVHFSGHGIGEGGLALEDNAGQVKLVSADALAAMFELCADQVECVLLNACYSEVQAEAIAQHISYVIGMNEAVGDRAALEFAVGFYDALGAGRSIESAFKAGCISIQLAGIPEHLTPILRRKGDGISNSSAAITQKAHENTSDTKWVLILDATLDENLSKEQLETVVERLRTLSGDISLKVDAIESGSIILKLDSTEEAFKVIQALHKEGKLTEVLGLPVKYVGYETSMLSASTTKVCVSNTKNIIDVFFSYSHKDEDLRNELATHLSILERDGVISGWCDRQISAGEEWADKIDDRMNVANVILLLVSADFIASNYCWNIEVKRAMERHEAEEARVIPVILRPVSWRRAPFGNLQALPKDAKPVTTWSSRDEAFLNISQSIEAVVNGLGEK